MELISTKNDLFDFLTWCKFSNFNINLKEYYLTKTIVLTCNKSIPGYEIKIFPAPYENAEDEFLQKNQYPLEDLIKFKFSMSVSLSFKIKKIENQKRDILNSKQIIQQFHIQDIFVPLSVTTDTLDSYLMSVIKNLETLEAESVVMK